MEISELRDYFSSSRNHIAAQAERLRTHSPELVVPIACSPIRGIVCAVDAGFVTLPLHGLDVHVSKTCTVLFEYEAGKLGPVYYFPSKFPQTQVDAQVSGDAHESVVNASLVRISKELDSAISASTMMVQHAKTPKILLLDGSLLPLASDRPANGGIEYDNVIIQYRMLYKQCKENNIVLVGVIKDPKGSLFVDAKVEGLKTSDTLFVDAFLKSGERTRELPVATRNTPVLKELGLTQDSIMCCYLKLGNDLPLRIEFFEYESIETVANMVSSLCTPSKMFTYPAALIEVDLRAMLDPQEIERVLKELELHAGMRPLRRNARPFR